MTYAFEIPCQRDGCRGIVKGLAYLQPLERDNPADYPDSVPCSLCRHEYNVSFTVQHADVCTDEVTGEEMEEEET